MARRVKHVVMIIPINAEVDEAEHVAEKRRHDFDQGTQLRNMRRAELQHHDRDQDGDHAVAERLETLFVHTTNVGARGMLVRCRRESSSTTKTLSRGPNEPDYSVGRRRRVRGCRLQRGCPSTDSDPRRASEWPAARG